MSVEATPRPWRVTSDDVEEIFIVGGDDEAILAMTDSDAFEDAEDLANADLIVQAVNTFSEREALLREAANDAAFMLARLDEWTNEAVTDENYRDWNGHVEPAIARVKASIARIRAALGETEEKEPT